MNHRVVFLQESDTWPLGRAWREYWNERNEDTTRKARSYISKEKCEARKRMHRKIRRTNKLQMRMQRYYD